MSSTTAENLRKFHSRQLHRVISTIKAEVDRAAETISQASESALTQITTRHDEYVTDLTIRQNEYVNGTFASLEQTSRIVENRLRNENRTIMEQVKAQLDKQIGVIFTERDNIYGHLSEQLNEQQWKLGEIGSHYKELNQQLTEEHLELRETIDHDKQQVEERQRLWEQTQLDQINELISQLHEYEEGHSNRINRLRSQFQERVVWQMNQLEWRMEEKMQQHNTTLTIAFQEFQEHVAKQLVDMADKNTNSLKPAIHTNSDRGIARFTFPTSTFQLGYPSYRYIMKANKPTIRYVFAALLLVCFLCISMYKRAGTGATGLEPNRSLTPPLCPVQSFPLLPPTCAPYAPPMAAQQLPSALSLICPVQLFPTLPLPQMIQYLDRNMSIGETSHWSNRQIGLLSHKTTPPIAEWLAIAIIVVALVDVLLCFSGIIFLFSKFYSSTLQVSKIGKVKRE